MIVFKLKEVTKVAIIVNGGQVPGAADKKAVVISGIRSPDRLHI